jgi:hypothetical protein
MTTLLERRLADPAPVTLAALDEAASLQVRRDRKYLVPVATAAGLVERLGDGARILEIDGLRMFGYRSVYFDTPELASYLAAARSRPRRYKVRTRTYLDSGRSVLELKTRDGRGHTVKDRIGHDPATGSRFDAGEVAFLAGHAEVGDAAPSLEPVLVNRYRRATLLLDDGSRCTIDMDLEAATPDGRGTRLCETAVVETKSAGAPSAADRALWELGWRPTRISKFCTSLAAIRPELPANRWTRALGRAWLTGEAGLRVPGPAPSPAAAAV